MTEMRRRTFRVSTTTPTHMWPTRGPKKHEPGTDVETDRQEHLVDGSLMLAGFPSELLVILAESSGTRWRCSSQRRT